MGNYVSSEELEERITTSALDDLTYGLSAGNKEKLIDNVIDEAEETCNASLSNLYITPLPASSYIKGLALKIAIYEMYMRGISGAVPPKFKDARAEALKELEEVGSGKKQPPRSSYIQRVDTYGSTIDIISDTPMVTQRQRWGYDTDENGTEYDEYYGSR